MKPYIVLSPVGDTRSKHLNSWLEAVKKLTPPPQEIVICVDADREFTVPNGITVLESPAMDYYKGHLERICSAREILRRYFLATNYPFSLWIDNDIMLPPETPQVLYKTLISENVYVVVNKYQGRGDTKWCGSGVMFMERDACLLSRFWVSYVFTSDGEEKHLSEDLIFFAIFDQGRHFIEGWSGKRGRVCDEYVKVNHILE